VSLDQVIGLHHLAARVPRALRRSLPVASLLPAPSATQQVPSGSMGADGQKQQLCTAAELSACRDAALRHQPLPQRKVTAASSSLEG